MRPIKFRAWDKVNNKMYVPPSEIDSSIGHWVMTTDGRTYVNGIYQDLILMQYTGLNDINSVEVYEGDIIKIEDHYEADSFVTAYLGEVVFNDGEFYVINKESQNGYCSLFDVVYNYKGEVIGNIFESPKALKEKIKPIQSMPHFGHKAANGKWTEITKTVYDKLDELIITVNTLLQKEEK